MTMTYDYIIHNLYIKCQVKRYVNPGWYDLWNTCLWYDLGKNRPPLAGVVLPAIAFLRNFERIEGQQDQVDW